MPLAVKIRGCAPPFTWLLNGAPVEAGGLAREIAAPAATGFVAVSVIDADGRAARVRVLVD
jgi:penicillin-binding protein 1C